MNIRDYVQKFLSLDINTDIKKDVKQSVEKAFFAGPASTAGIASLEGMSSATARFIIDRHVPENFTERWEVTDLANRGRYFIAKVVAPDGQLIDEILVDKQNGAVHFLKGRFTR